MGYVWLNWSFFIKEFLNNTICQNYQSKIQSTFNFFIKIRYTKPNGKDISLSGILIISVVHKINYWLHIPTLYKAFILAIRVLYVACI